jgi:hypothetical protein
MFFLPAPRKAASSAACDHGDSAAIMVKGWLKGSIDTAASPPGISEQRSSLAIDLVWIKQTIRVNEG